MRSHRSGAVQAVLALVQVRIENEESASGIQLGFARSDRDCSVASSNGHETVKCRRNHGTGYVSSPLPATLRNRLLNYRRIRIGILPKRDETLIDGGRTRGIPGPG